MAEDVAEEAVAMAEVREEERVVDPLLVLQA